MTTHKSITHDSGPPVSSHYTLSIIDPQTRGSITVGSALNGSAYGLRLVMSGGFGSADFKEGMAALPGNSVRLRIYVDPNSVTPPSGSSSIEVSILESSGNALIQAGLVVSFNSAGNTYRVVGQIQDDSTNFQQSSAYALTDAPHCIEIGVNRASSTVASNGSFTLYVDGVAQETVSNLDIFDNWPNINQIDVFGSATGTGASGSAYIDEILVDDSSASALCSAGDEWTAAPMKRPCDIDADGTYIYIAALDSSGQPTLIKFSTALTANGEIVFQPGAGSDIGIECARQDADLLVIAGNFGTTFAQSSQDAGTSFSDITPPAGGAIKSFVTGPDDDRRILVFDDTANDLLESLDTGDTWTTVNASVAQTLLVMARLGIDVQQSVFGASSADALTVQHSMSAGADLAALPGGPDGVDVNGLIVNG